MPEKLTSSEDRNKETTTSINRRKYLKLASMAGTGFGTGLGASTLGNEFTTPARAATAVVDDFGNTNLSGRYVFDQRGATTSVSTVSSAVTSGADTNVLQMDGGGDTRMHAYKGDGDTDLNAYPENGDTFSCWMRGLNGTENMNFIYGAQDKDNKYYVKLNPESGDLGLFKYVSGSGYSLTGDWSNSTIQDNTGWFKLEIQWTSDHTHTVTLYQNGSQVTSFSYTEGSSDPQFTATGVGYSAYLNSGETAQFDYATTTGSSSSLSKWENNAEHSIVEDFELTNLSEDYTFDRGNPEGASLVRDSDYSGPNEIGITYTGGKALQLSGANTEMTRQPSDGLSNYPEPGTTSSCWVMATGGADRLNLSYGVSDPENRYFVRVNFAKDRFVLYKCENNSSSAIGRDNSGYSLSQDTWYWVEIHWGSDGTHTVELYDRDDNTLAKVSEVGDSNLESGRGIGFDAYLENVSGSIIFDGFVLGEQDPQKGGWGNYQLCDYVSKDNDGDGIYHNYNFQYALGHPGKRGPFTTTVNNTEVEYYEYDFPLTSSFHTYTVDHEAYKTDPDPSDVSAYSVQDKTVFSLDIQNTATSNFDYVDINQNQTKTFFLKPADYRTWIENNWGQQTSRDETKEKHIQEYGNDRLWEAFFSAVGAGLGFAATPIVAASGVTIGIGMVLRQFYDTDCGKSETAESNFHKIAWDYCDQYPLSGHVVQFTVAVPTGETVEAVVKSQLDPEKTIYPADNTGKWTVEITGGERSTNVLSKQPVCNR